VITRCLAARILIGLGLSCCAILALASALVLHGSALVWVVVAAGLAAAVAYSARYENRAAAGAYQAAGWAVASIMIVTGAVVVGGGVMAALVIGLAVVVGGAVWLPRVIRARSGKRDGAVAAAAAEGATSGASMPMAAVLDHSPTPVSLMATLALGREWSRTSAALRSRLEPVAREMLIQRRQDVLDELERRDPVGFAGWLVTAHDAGDDPADFVRRGRTAGGDTA
jgi:hypothetical protein